MESGPQLPVRPRLTSPQATCESRPELSSDLHTAGWRQGSVFDAQLDAISLTVADEDVKPEAVRIWLADAATRIRPDLGVVAHVQVGTSARTSLELVETSYAVDLSQLTWSGTDPTGAT